MILIMKRRGLLAAALGLAALTAVTGCGSGNSTTTAASGAAHRPRVVVTYSVLGAVIKDVVGTAGDVTVLMPNGANPHEWSPSAKDVTTMLKADLVIDNGLGLEGNLQDPLKQAKADGVRVFTVSDHITVRRVKAGEGAEPDDPDQAPGAEDPHLWTDPLTMKEWVPSLVPVLAEVGIDAKANAAKVTTELDELNTQVTALVAQVPAAHRKLVTGHESMGYFAQRYGFTLVGAVIPAITSQAEASSGELAALTAKIKANGVPAIFAEIGTPAATVQAVAKDSGAKVVELSTHNLPADGTYRTFILDLATTITGALK
jgi:zinc/manganese transport system substrate-binding protein